jgi:phosphorylase kinase alpha/beta subunit
LEEIHSSSLGACVAGLRIISKFFNVPPELVNKGNEKLKNIIPRESEKKQVDLSLLSLIYPYNLLDGSLKEEVLKNIEEKLIRNMGVIRYLNDHYYNKNGEAEWTMGFPWLAIIYKDMDKAKYDFYIKKSLEVMNKKGEFPELYFSNSQEHNDNTPLAWSHSLFIVALAK